MPVCLHVVPFLKERMKEDRREEKEVRQEGVGGNREEEKNEEGWGKRGR